MEILAKGVGWEQPKASFHSGFYLQFLIEIKTILKPKLGQI